MVRRAVVALAVGLVALALVPVAATFAQSTSGVHADSEGWWNTGPATPVTLPPSPLGTLPAAPAPDVPDGSVPVAMRLGQAARVGAIGIVVDATKGSKVNALTLTLKEAAAAGQEGSGAKVRACPITDFLQPEANGPAENAPAENCDVAHADGVRAADGTWTFDLTAIASAWLDPFGTVEPNGIRLDPVGDPPATFQVAFTGYEDATLTADIVAGAPAADPFATGGAAGSFDSGSLGSGSTDFSAPAAEAPAVATPTTAAPKGAAAPNPKPAKASRAGDTFGNWPATVVLLLVAAVALALATAWTLGPAGRRRDDLTRRQGGVSRALAGRLTASHRA
ncbi:MAG: hypothetical protein JWN67_3197 [Actinomycetia bacterium]|nr:hypothetical protein [Actinomycetes bacterium]